MSEPVGSKLRFWKTPFFRAFIGSPSGGFAVILACVLIGTALLAPIAFTEEEVYQRNIRRKLEGPSADYILGTDNLGRDILKRTIFATRLSLELAISAAGMAIVLGFTTGAIVAYLPGKARNIGVRIIEVLLAFPGILIAVMLVAVFGASAQGAVLAIGIAFSPSLARVAYTLASSVAGLEYISSARVLSISNRRIILRYLIPNIAETLILISFNSMAAALVAVSSLSFLGLGVQGTEFDWGRLITEGVQRLYQVPSLALAPAVAIGTTGLAFGYMGEALARALNPLLWTKKANTQYQDWIQRYLSPDILMLISAGLMLISFYFLPWFNPEADASNRALITGLTLLEGTADMPSTISLSLDSLAMFRTSAILGMILGLIATIFIRYRRYLSLGGFLAGLLGAGFYAVFFAQNGFSLDGTQLGFYCGLIGVVGLLIQAIFGIRERSLPRDKQFMTDTGHIQEVRDASKGDGELLLRVRGLNVQFATPTGTIQPVNNFNLDLAKGEIVGVVGESGSGKSMTALSLAQLVPYPGQISYEEMKLQGENIAQLSPARVRHLYGTEIAMIFQDPMSSLNPALTVGTQLTEASLVHRPVSRKEVYKLALDRMADVHIPAAETRLKQYPHQFSGGMRQRAMIAMGLMTQPALIIADEPTTALDVTIQAQILDVLREINREYGTAIILISHDIGVIVEICSRVLVMYAGRVVEDIQASELLTAKKHPYTEALIEAIPRLDADRDQPLASIKGRPPDLDRLPVGCPFAPRCPYVVDRCREEDPPLVQVGDQHAMACFVRVAEINTIQDTTS